MSVALNPLERVALVFGASGITAWAILREASHLTNNSFRGIIGLSNRPTDPSQLLLLDSNKITFASGVDLSASVDQVTAALSGIDNIENVTDVFFAAYIQPPGTSDFEGHEIVKEVNTRILETAVLAVERSCPRLRFWSLQTGGKSYGFTHVREIGIPKVPCDESDPRIPQPYQDQVFYYAQSDALKRLSTGRRWRFSEIRPDLVIGFVPGGKNAMNLAQALGLFLSFYADREARSAAGGKLVQFPGTAASYNAHHTEVGQSTLARAHIFASNFATAPNSEIYNVGDSPHITGLSWREKWAAICGYFDLVGVGPGEGEAALSAGRYMLQHQSEWKGFEDKHGLTPSIIQHTSWEFLEVLLSLATFDRQYNLSKLAAAGFHENADIAQNYFEAFQLMEMAKIIPRRRPSPSSPLLD